MKVNLVIKKDGREVQAIFKSADYPLEVIKSFIPEEEKDKYSIETHEVRE